MIHTAYLSYLLPSLAWSLLGLYTGLIAGPKVDRWRRGRLR